MDAEQEGGNTAVITTRVPRELKDEIERAAARERMRVGPYVRSVLLLGMAVSGNRYASSELSRGLARFWSIAEEFESKGKGKDKKKR